MTKDTTNAPKRVLIVEDNEDISYLLSYILKRAGFEVEQAHDGQIAETRIARNDPPSAVLLDVMLPYTDGFALLNQIRTSRGWETVPVLMLTAKTQEDDVVKALEAGANDYVSKPFQPKEVLARLRRMIPQVA